MIIIMTDSLDEEFLISFGREGRVILAEEKGFCYKCFSQKNWDPNLIAEEVKIHQRLKEAGINTFDTYEPDYENCRIKMTDLSDRRRNLVASDIDFFNLGKLSKREYSLTAEFSWLKGSRNRMVLNPNEFFQELEAIIAKAIKIGLDYHLQIFF